MRLGLAAVLSILGACGASIGSPGNSPDATDSIDAPPIDATPDARPCTGGDQSMMAPDGSCLMFFGATQNYVDAKATCVAASAHLAFVTSAALDAVAVQLAGANDTFIGLSDQITEGTFVWDDGSPLVYSNWELNEPSNGGGHYQEDCVVIAGKRPDKQWDDRPCAPVPMVGGGLYSVLCQF
jgi:hypothetical protein